MPPPKNKQKKNSGNNKNKNNANQDAQGTQPAQNGTAAPVAQVRPEKYTLLPDAEHYLDEIVDLKIRHGTELCSCCFGHPEVTIENGGGKLFDISSSWCGHALRLTLAKNEKNDSEGDNQLSLVRRWDKSCCIIPRPKDEYRVYSGKEGNSASHMALATIRWEKAEGGHYVFHMDFDNQQNHPNQGSSHRLEIHVDNGRTKWPKGVDKLFLIKEPTDPNDPHSGGEMANVYRHYTHGYSAKRKQKTSKIYDDVLAIIGLAIIRREMRELEKGDGCCEICLYPLRLLTLFCLNDICCFLKPCIPHKWQQRLRGVKDGPDDDDDSS